MFFGVFFVCSGAWFGFLVGVGGRKLGDTFNNEACPWGDPGLAQNAGSPAGPQCFWGDGPQDQKTKCRFLKAARWASPSTPFVEQEHNPETLSGWRAEAKFLVSGGVEGAFSSEFVRVKDEGTATPACAPLRD